MKIKLFFLFLLLILTHIAFAQNGVYYNDRGNLYMYIVGNRVEVTSDPVDAYSMFNMHREVGFVEWNARNDSVKMTLTEVDGMVFTTTPDPLDSAVINPNYGRFAVAQGTNGNDLSGWFYDNLNSGWYFKFLRDTVGLAVSLASFTGTYNNGIVELKWVTLSENSNYGFYIEKSLVNTADTSWKNIGFRPGHNTTLVPQYYSFVDSFAVQHADYRLKQVDNNGAVHYSGVWSYDVPLYVDDNKPTEFFLKQNYPNPFNGMTTIQFSVDREQLVSLTIYDSIGRQISQLAYQRFTPGVHTFVWHTIGITSGTYYCLFQPERPEEHSVIEMVLIK